MTIWYTIFFYKLFLILYSIYRDCKELSILLFYLWICRNCCLCHLEYFFGWACKEVVFRIKAQNDIFLALKRAQFYSCTIIRCKFKIWRTVPFIHDVSFRITG